MERTKKIATQLLQGAKYLYAEQITGIVGTLVYHYDCPLSQETIEDVKEVLIEHFFDGMDPEWEDESMFEWWEGLSVDWFQPSPNDKDLICSHKPSHRSIED